jgi:hypothetical protein
MSAQLGLYVLVNVIADWASPTIHTLHHTCPTLQQQPSTGSTSFCARSILCHYLPGLIRPQHATPSLCSSTVILPVGGKANRPHKHSFRPYSGVTCTAKAHCQLASNTANGQERAYTAQPQQATDSKPTGCNSSSRTQYSNNSHTQTGQMQVHL